MRPVLQLLQQFRPRRRPASDFSIRHLPILETRLLSWPDEAACADFAVALSRRPGLREATIELDGPLGAGKTTLARHLLVALGIGGRIKSPTYAIVELYEIGGSPIAHFDFYRFGNPREWEDAGLRELFGQPGLKLVEWASRAAPLLPDPDLRIRIAPVSETARAVTVEACTLRGQGLLP